MDSLVRPVQHRSKQKPVASCGLLAVNPSDVHCFGALSNRHGLKKRFLFNAHLYDGPEFFVAGPAVGAPMAALCLESLVTLGASRIIVYSWCGSLQPQLVLGNLFMPLAAVSEEGTSRHYPYQERGRDSSLEEALHSWLVCQDLAPRQGSLWSTDAPFRETRKKITRYADQGVWAVDMEYAALRAVAAFRHVQLAALFMVSDELFHSTWRPGFTAQTFRRASQERLQHLCSFFGDLRS